MNKTIHPLLWLLLILLSVPNVVSAQRSMIVKHYTQDDGLPSNTIYSAVKGSDGFMWFGTWHGLCSFDGTLFTPYITRPSRDSDLPPRKVRDMIDDGTGRLWICNTDNRLFVFDKRKETYHDIYSELKKKARNVQVIKIQFMDNGHILVLTRNKDLFETYVGSNGEIHVSMICDSRNYIDAATMKLRKDMLGENGRYIYWVNRKFDIDAVKKSSATRVLPSNVANYTCFSRTNQYLCAGTSRGDIYIIRYKGGAKTSHYSFKGINGPITSIDIVNGTVCFTTPNAIYTFTKGTQPRAVARLPQAVIKTFIDSFNKLWLCSDGEMLVCHNPASGLTQTFKMPTDNPFNEIKFCDAGSNGLFTLMRNGELWRYDHASGIMQNVNRTPEFSTFVSDPHYFDVDIDPAGTMWLSSTDCGIYKIGFPRNSFRLLYTNLLSSGDKGESDGIRSVYQDKRGDLWIGTRRGTLCCIDSATGSVKRRFNKTDVGAVYHIMEDRQGNYWFSTKGAGLVMATPDPLAPQGIRLRRFTNTTDNRNSLSSNHVYHTFQDSRGRIWVCTFNGGLNLITEKNGETVFMNKRNGFDRYPKYELYNDVRTIIEDRNGRIWAGTTDGLMSFDGNFSNPKDIEFETYREHSNADILCNDIYTMFLDHVGRIWMGVFGNGLNLIEKYDGKTHKPQVRPYGISGNPGDVITSIAEDHERCLWICTEKGLASLSFGAKFTHSYDIFAGLPSVDIEENTSMCLNDGRIVIGTRQGLLSLNPQIVKNENDRRLTTFITGFKVADRNLRDFDPPLYTGSIKYATEVTLKHDLSTFTIEFSSPYYADNAMLQYSYILDGYEEQWHNSGNNRIASYANVPPGHYKFRVKVNDGISPERVLSVVITPPWWATWRAYALYTIVALLALYGVARLILYMIRMRNEVYINDRLAELKIRFFTNVSHELRTPLSLIKGPIDELKANEKLSAEGKEYLDLIDRNARKMLQLVNQILDFRKVQNGKMKMRMSLVEVAPVIDMLMQEFKLLADERKISFVFNKPDYKVCAWCDAEKIGVVLNNLISNAFKYTDDRGTISVTLEQDTKLNTCRVMVEDDGAEIPKSQLEQIFERFSQAGNKTSDDTAATGTGIGLNLSREYINMHHGRIWAENRTEGSGVVFSIEFPMGREQYEGQDTEVYFDDNTAAGDTTTETEAESETTADLPQNKDDGDRPAVILIEDNVDMCRMLQLRLRKDYNVIAAHNGEDGLRKIYDSHPDLIITDLMMPGIDGMELLHRVRQDFNISHIPVIVLTAKNTEEAKMAAVRSGANAFITKPFSSSYLMARIDQLLEEQRTFQRKTVVQNAIEDTSDSETDEYGSHLVKKDLEFVKKIHAIIEENLNSNDFNIDTIAETIGLSRSAFFKKLKSLTGFAPVDLVREIRLNKAAKLMESTDSSITEIAYTVGFRDAGYFGKCFRKKYGMTPKEFRNAATTQKG